MKTKTLNTGDVQGKEILSDEYGCVQCLHGTSIMEVQLRERTEMCAESVHLTDTVRFQSGGSAKTVCV